MLTDDRLFALFDQLEGQAVPPDRAFQERLLERLRLETRSRRGGFVLGPIALPQGYRPAALAVVFALLMLAALLTALIGSRLLLRPSVEDTLRLSHETYESLPPFEMAAHVAQGNQAVRIVTDGQVLRWELLDGYAWGIEPRSYVLTDRDGRREGYLSHENAWVRFDGLWPMYGDMHLLTWLHRTDAGDVEGPIATAEEDCAAWADGGPGTVLGRVADVVACAERRWWVDHDTGIVLRYAIGDEVQEEATSFTTEPEIPTGLLAMEPPPSLASPSPSPDALPGPTPICVAAECGPTASPTAASSSPVSAAVGSFDRVQLPLAGSLKPDLALRDDGTAVVTVLAQQADQSLELRLISCRDLICSARGEVASLLPDAFVSDVAVTLQGVPLIVAATFDGDVAFVRCLDRECAQRPAVTALPGRVENAAVGIAVRGDGLDDLARIVVAEADAGLVAILCQDDLCESPKRVGLDGTAHPTAMSVRAASDGRIVVAYALPTGEVRLAICTDAECSAVRTVTVATGGIDTITAALALTKTGIPVVAYYRVDEVRVTRCVDVECSAVRTATIDRVENIWWSPIAIALTPDPVVLYWWPTEPRDPRLAICTDADCSAPPRLIQLSGSEIQGDFETTTFALRLGGTPFMVNSSLQLEFCRDPACGT